MSGAFLPVFRRELNKTQPDAERLRFGLRLIIRELNVTNPATRRWGKLHNLRRDILVVLARPKFM